MADHPPPHYVIVGAGPAAYGAALALSERQCRITVLDTGLSLESDRDATRKRLASVEPPAWSAQDLALTHSVGRVGDSPAIKYLFGSDVAFRNDEVVTMHSDPDVGGLVSHAFGGLSNVWGAGVCNYTATDLSNWPISEPELTRHAAAVMAHLPYSAERDDLEEIYPILREPDGLLTRTPIAASIAARARRHQLALRAQGNTIGAARLAVRVGEPAPQRGCVYCRHCLDGCPYDHIYSARYGIEQLVRAGRIDYVQGRHVRTGVQETDGGVTITGVALEDSRPFHVAADRVFLAAGALGTTVILQLSHLIDEVDLLDSQTVFVPLLYTGRIENRREAAYTLAQLFLITSNATISPRAIHASLYTFDDSVLERAERYHPHLTRLVRPLSRRYGPRLVVAICFLHSDDSGKFSVKVRDEETARVHLSGKRNVRTRDVVHRFERHLWKSLPRLGLIPLPGLTQLATIGGGFHFGGSVPMTGTRTHATCDLLGRPHPTERVHVVDAACFPSVPAGTITLPIMANAHRIATGASALDDGPHLATLS